MFTDISNSTKLSADLEIEEYVELLDQFRDGLARVMAHHGGIIIRLDGDGGLCAFGHPHPLEDAGRRAVEAAIDFHALVADEIRLGDDQPLLVHTGIHAGIVAVQAGDTARGVIEVLGKPTNVAARLCDHARPDGIIVSNDALGLDRDFFQLQPAGDYSPGGTEKAMPLFRVAGRSSATDRLAARRQGHASPYLGREHDLGMILAWLAAPQPPLMLVAGEAGIGKSRFVAELLSRLPEAAGVAAVGSCEAYPAARPMQALRQIANALAPDVAPTWPDVHLPDQLKAYLRGLAADQRRLLVIDDWQWADDATVSFVDWLLTEPLPGIRIMAMSRYPDVRVAVSTGHAVHLLAHLHPADATALIGTILPRADPLTARQINGAAGGNPLLIEEICRDPAIARGGNSGGRVNLRLNSLIARRLALLPLAQATAIKACAIIGHRVPVFLLAAALGWGNDVAPRDAVQATGFFRYDSTTDTLVFRHGLIRDAVYDHISTIDRRAIHQQIAAVLLERQDNGDVAELSALAYHLAAAGHELAFGFAMTAGDRALSLGSLDQALAHYRSAIQRIIDSGTAVTAADIGRIGARYISAALPDPHRDHLEPLTRLTDLAHRRGFADVSGKAQYWLASLHYVVGEPRPALAALQSFTANAPSATGDGRDRGEQALLMAMAGQSAMLDNHHPRALEQINQAMATLGTTASRNLRESLVYMFGMRGQIHGDQGNFAAAFADFASAVDMVGPSPPAMFGSVLSQRAAVELWAERFDDCRATMNLSRDFGDRVGSRYVMMISRSLLAYVDWLQHRSPSALATIDRSNGWFAESGSRYSLALSLGWAADVAWQMGDHARATDNARRSIALGATALRWGAPLAFRVAALASAERAESLGYLRRAYAMAARMQSPREWAQAMLCDAALCSRFGDADMARQRHDAAQQMRAAMGLPVRV